MWPFKSRPKPKFGYGQLVELERAGNPESRYIIIWGVRWVCLRTEEKPWWVYDGDFIHMYKGDIVTSTGSVTGVHEKSLRSTFIVEVKDRREPGWRNDTAHQGGVQEDEFESFCRRAESRRDRGPMEIESIMEHGE